jgi:hypothetical protein
MENAVIFYAHLEFIITIWYILWSCGNFVHVFSVLVYCLQKNLATLFSVHFK